MERACKAEFGVDLKYHCLIHWFKSIPNSLLFQHYSMHHEAINSYSSSLHFSVPSMDKMQGFLRKLALRNLLTWALSSFWKAYTTMMCQKAEHPTERAIWISLLFYSSNINCCYLPWDFSGLAFFCSFAFTHKDNKLKFTISYDS